MSSFPTLKKRLRSKFEQKIFLLYGGLHIPIIFIVFNLNKADGYIALNIFIDWAFHFICLQSIHIAVSLPFQSSNIIFEYSFSSRLHSRRLNQPQ